MRLRDNYFKDRKFECVERNKNLLRKKTLIDRAQDEAKKGWTPGPVI